MSRLKNKLTKVAEVDNVNKLYELLRESKEISNNLQSEFSGMDSQTFKKVNEYLSTSIEIIEDFLRTPY